MGKQRRFTQEFKLEAVRLLKVGARPAAEIVRELVTEVRQHEKGVKLRQDGGCNGR